MTIAKKIKHLRIQQGMSQEDLAGQVFSRSYISQIECGLVLPSSKAILHMADLLKIPARTLVDKDTIDKVLDKDQVFDLFLEGRKAYMDGAYEDSIKILTLVIQGVSLLDRSDLISGRVWLAQSYFELDQVDQALALAEEFLEDTLDYSRAEKAIVLSLNHLKGIILYDKGHYNDSLQAFLFLEATVRDQALDMDKALVLDCLSRIQMLYESLGHHDQVMAYKEKIMAASKRYNIIGKGTLRSLNRYYRDHSTDSIEAMVAYYHKLIHMAHTIGDTYRVSLLYSSIVELYLKHGCIDKLEESLKTSEQAMAKIKSPAIRGYNFAFHNLFTGRYYLLLKDFDKALQYYTKAQAFISDQKYSKSIKLEIDSLYHYGELYYHKGAYESAALYLNMAEAVSQKNDTTVRDPKLKALRLLINKAQE